MNLMDPTQFAAAWNQIEDTRTEDSQEIREAFERDQEETDERTIRDREDE